MSYSKTTWATGDTITAQLLNHAEDGIAANDAAIAAIPAGVQLYGPYKASNSSATAQANKITYLELATVEDLNGATVSYPQDTTAKLFPTGFSTGNIAGVIPQEMSVPYISDNAWAPAYFYALNTTGSDIASNAYILFYSTAEFPLES